MNGKKVVSLLCVVLLSLVFACSCSSESEKEKKPFQHPKVKALDFTLPDLDGNKVNLKDKYEKQPVLLYFWATWCPHCRKAPEKLKKLMGKYGSDKLLILAINVGSGDSLERVKRYRDKNCIPYTILYDKGSQVTKNYNVRGIPLFILVDTDGYIVYFSHEVPEKLDRFLKKS